MTNNTTRRILMGLCTILTVFVLLAVTVAAQTRKRRRSKGPDINHFAGTRNGAGCRRKHRRD
jgi:hypothetical protein